MVVRSFRTAIENETQKEVVLSTVLCRRNRVAFHPGCFIAEVMEELDLSSSEVASRLGYEEKDILEVLNGEKRLTWELAQELPRVLGGTEDYWMNLQWKFDEIAWKIRERK